MERESERNPENADVGATERRRALSLRGLAQLVVGLGALTWVIIRADARGLLEAVRATDAMYLPLAVAATVAVNWLMAYRWGVILRVRGVPIPTARLFVYYLVGIFFMNFVPGGGVSGDVARLIYADREVRDKPFVLSTLIYERLVGLFTLLLIGLGAMLASRANRPSAPVFYFVEAVLAAAFLGSALLMSDYVSTRLARLCRHAGTRFKLERIGIAAARTIEAISELRRYKRMLAATVLLSVLIRVVWSLGCFVVARAMGLPLGLPAVFGFISLVDLIRMLPISVGGLGVREWVMVLLFANAGLAREQALMFSFLAFAPVFLNALIGGAIYTSGMGLARHKRVATDVAIKSVEAR
ncbi:MAG TPA: lysylphosphatidylglycerol synthase transmembrane domain-containing protein [Blastocatellia bacterium]|nr:lysylphosphatidylglycerol synthase transmembrane domain-containing protein [Blastocatellia bacterium]